MLKAAEAARKQSDFFRLAVEIHPQPANVDDLSANEIKRISPGHVGDSEYNIEPADVRAKVQKVNETPSIQGLLNHTIQEQAPTPEKNRASPEVHGTCLSSLPPEVLLLIFETAAQTCHELCQLSQVCSRFRNLLQSAPGLWSRRPLTTAMSSDYIKHCIAMAHDLGLAVRVQSPGANPACDASCYRPGSVPQGWHPRINTLLAYRHRWREFELDAMAYGAERLSYRIHCVLPMLRRLVIHGGGRPDTYRFCEQWSFPVLERLDVFDFTPPAVFGPSLVDFRATLGHLDDLPGLMDFLRSVPSLQHLGIAITSEFGSRSGVPPLASCTLPNVTSATMSAEGSEESYDALKKIAECLCLPNLSELKLSITYVGEKCSDGLWQEDILDLWKGQESLKSIHIILEEEEPYVLCFGEILEHVPPRLEHLMLEARNSHIEMRWPSKAARDRVHDNRPTHLRSLSFRECYMPHRFVVRLCDYLVSAGVELESLRVLQCGLDVDRGYLPENFRANIICVD
ncbi:hypothetical protein DFH11DRAFT_1732853 [Phellopilus nigrolimitatus]|nr:hypothetical protein DFH11DRAFT_1732853 [Phellopilus nigrolimitatus]